MARSRGRPRTLDFSKLGREYVEEILSGGFYGALNRLGKKWGVGRNTAKDRIRRAHQYGKIPTYIQVMDIESEMVMADLVEEGCRPLGYVRTGSVPAGRIYLEVADALDTETAESVNETGGAGEPGGASGAVSAEPLE